MAFCEREREARGDQALSRLAAERMWPRVACALVLVQLLHLDICHSSSYLPVRLQLVHVVNTTRLQGNCLLSTRWVLSGLACQAA